MIFCCRLFIFLIYLIFFLIASFALAVITIIGGVIAWMMPVKAWRQYLIKLLLTTPVAWASVCNGMLRLAPPKHHWDIQGQGPLSEEAWYVLIANHLSALDILLMGLVFNRKTPVTKFFMKKELLWGLPFLGFACWM